MHGSGSHNHSMAVTRIITRTRFLSPLTITVSSTLLPATVLIPITTGSGPDAFTPVFHIPRVVSDLLGTIFLNLAISLPHPHLSLFHVSSNLLQFLSFLTKKIKKKNQSNIIFLLSI